MTTKPPIGRDTRLCMSLSARPGNFGSRFHNRLYELTGLNQYEAYRLEAGLAEDLPFIQKTGTQQGRACHVGVARPETPEQALIIIACAADLDENREAGALFERIGEAIQQTVLQPRAG